MQENLLKRKSEIIYSILLVVFVCSIYFSSLFNPPRSDYWHLFYSFHELENAPPLMRWLNLLNYDNFEKMRYQPLSRLSHYFLYLTVGSNFLFFNLFNLVLYIVSIVLLYKFASIFCNNKIIPKVFAGLFAVLFTHADIVLWLFPVGNPVVPAFI